MTCRCPHCAHDAWLRRTLRHNAAIAMAHAEARRDPEGIRRVTALIAELNPTEEPT